MEQWEKNYYISSIAGANNGSSLVVMSKGILISMINLWITLPYFLCERHEHCLIWHLHQFNSFSTTR